MRIRLLELFLIVKSTMALRRSWIPILRNRYGLLTAAAASGRMFGSQGAMAAKKLSPAGRALCTAAVLVASISTTSLAAAAGSGEGAEGAEAAEGSDKFQVRPYL